MTATAPPFTYAGGKTTVAGRIVSLLPAHKSYVECFAGGLAVLLAKQPVKFETINDLDGAVVYLDIARGWYDEVLSAATER